MAIAKFALSSSKFNGNLEFVLNYAWKDTPAGKFVIQKCQLTIGDKQKECELRFTSGRGQAANIQYYVYIVIPSEKFAAYTVKFSINYDVWNEIKTSENIVLTELKNSEENSGDNTGNDPDNVILNSRIAEPAIVEETPAIEIIPTRKKRGNR